MVVCVGVCAWPVAARAGLVSGSLNTAVNLNVTGYNPPSPEIRRFDVNGDGLTDLEFNYYFDPNASEYAYARVQAAGIAPSGQFAGPASDHPLARAFAPGEVVGPTTAFVGAASLMGIYRTGLEPSVSYVGEWGNGALLTAGFKFTDANANVRYGWFRAFVDFDHMSLFLNVPEAVIVVDYEYESEPGTRIVVPAPGAMGVVVAMGVWGGRRRRG